MFFRKKVIIRVDGGFCSQLAFIALGHCLELQGINVRYDLSWFDKHGMDMDNKFDRSYVFNKAFPNINIKCANRFERWLYKHFYQFKWAENKVPYRLYIRGYPEREHLIQRYKDYFISEFNPVDKDSILDLLSVIATPKSCAVHVRRGDLAKPNPFYGEPPTYKYFLDAIQYVKQQMSDVEFFFFSDEMDWVKDNIIPRLGSDIIYHTCDKNGSNKGYLDVYLMSNAAAIIASHGSFGPTGFYLNKNNKVVYVSPKTLHT